MSDPTAESVTLQVLKSHPLFQAIEDRDLIRLLFHSKQQTFPKGYVIVKENEMGSMFYVLLKGAVEILKNVPTTHGISDERIAYLRRGETFGEMQAIDEQPRSATVRTTEETIVMTFDRVDLDKLADTDPHIHALITRNLAREVCRKLRQIDARFAIALFAEDQQAAD